MLAGPAFYDELIRVPLLIRGPGIPRPAKIDQIVSTVDLCPTLCELAAVEAPFGIQGRSMMPLIRDRGRANWGQEAFVEFYRQAGWNPQPAAAGPVGMPAPPPAAPATSAPGSTASGPRTRPADPAFAASRTAPAPAPAVVPPLPPAPPHEARVRGIVADHFKLIDFLDDQDLLYDLRRDPGEMQNVISDSHYRVVQRVLYDRLRIWRRQTGDPLPAQ